MLPRAKNKMKTGASPRRTVAPTPTDALGAGAADALGARTADGTLLGSGALSVGTALGRTGAGGGGGSGSGSGSTLAAAEAASGTSADADGAGCLPAAAPNGRPDALTEATGAADAEAEAALGALSARASRTPNSAPQSSASRAKKASRSPQTRARTHEYDEDLTWDSKLRPRARRLQGFPSRGRRTGRSAAEAIAKILGRG